MKKIVDFIDRLSKIFGMFAGIIMVFGVVLILIEVIVRAIFNSTIYITAEYTAYFMVAITFFGLALTLKDNEHIRIVFLQKLIKEGKPRLFLDIYSLIVGLIVFLIITLFTVKYFWSSVITGSQSMQFTQTYLAIPQFVMPLGSFLISLQFVAEIIKTITKFRKGKQEKEESKLKALGR